MEIKKALYGNKETFKDVVEIIQNSIINNRIYLKVNNNNFNYKPQNNCKNELEILYILNNKKIIQKFQEDEWVLINNIDITTNTNSLNYTETTQKPIYIYFHICCLNNWLSIVNNIINTIKKSELYENVKQIKCFLLGDIDNIPKFFDDKILFIKHSLDKSLYERFTLNHLYEDSFKEDFNVLYLHSKGITRNENKNVTDWVNYMLYFNISKYESILKNLNTYDCVGVNLYKRPVTHYSGNFWWSTSNHIKKLNKTIGPKYLDPEFWVTSIKNGKYLSLWNSNINHYRKSYQEKKYIKSKLMYFSHSFY